ncbi:PGF-CTERM sorting domain-containing protein [Halarchaeum sp. P4]|uniref:PGF-CTERM sorting domain-containing protein n=1 Tax=Halarchaeum sp. P4 TaxID=3421639 RepID=UPI003EC01EF3
MNGKFSRSILAALLALTVIAGTSGLAAAAGTATIEANPSTPDRSATHTVTQTVGSNVASASWTGYKITYPDGSADVSNVTMADVETIGIDRGNDDAGKTVDVSVSDDLDGVSASNNGGTLTLNLGGSYSLNESDQVVVSFGNATNPGSVGDYNVSTDINPQSSGGEASATLSITKKDVTTTTTSTTETTTTQQSTTTSSGSTTTTTETTSGGSPGFGAGLALVALAGAALVAARQH